MIVQYFDRIRECRAMAMMSNESTSVQSTGRGLLLTTRREYSRLRADLITPAHARDSTFSCD